MNTRTPLHHAIRGIGLEKQVVVLTKDTRSPILEVMIRHARFFVGGRVAVVERWTAITAINMGDGVVMDEPYLVVSAFGVPDKYGDKIAIFPPHARTDPGDISAIELPNDLIVHEMDVWLKAAPNTPSFSEGECS